MDPRHRYVIAYAYIALSISADLQVGLSFSVKDEKYFALTEFFFLVSATQCLQDYKVVRRSVDVYNVNNLVVEVYAIRELLLAQLAIHFFVLYNDVAFDSFDGLVSLEPLS